MNRQGKYIYGIIATEDAPNFGPMGIGGGNDEVTTIGTEGLAAVVSNASMDHYVLSKANLTTHTKVVEKVMDGKIEVDIKIIWTDMKKLYDEIVKENKKLRELKVIGTMGNRQSLINAGVLVATALEDKKAVEGGRYLRPFKKAAAECKDEKPNAEDMVAHAAFLIDKGWLKEFDNAVEEVGEEFKERIQIHYVGPLPPFSFVNFHLPWDE